MSTPFTDPTLKKDAVAETTCTAMGDILNRIGDKWSVMIVGHLTHGTMRFNELRHAIGGISQRICAGVWQPPHQGGHQQGHHRWRHSVVEERHGQAHEG